MTNTVLRGSRTVRVLVGLGAVALVASMICTVRRRPAKWTPEELALLKLFADHSSH